MAEPFPAADAYLLEFAKVAGAHLLAVASPGPDFAIVLRQSLARGRRAAIWTSLGVGCGICFHVTYSLLGIGLLLVQSPTGFAILKYAGAAYLGAVGVQCLASRRRNEGQGGGAESTPASDGPAGRRGSFVAGFLTNALNPKATLFFLALFSVVISPATPAIVRAGYGAWMVVATAAWFCLVSVVFTHEPVRARFLRHGHWIDRALGVVFLAFGVSLVVG